MTKTARRRIARLERQQEALGRHQEEITVTLAIDRADGTQDVLRFPLARTGVLR